MWLDNDGHFLYLTSIAAYSLNDRAAILAGVNLSQTEKSHVVTPHMNILKTSGLDRKAMGSMPDALKERYQYTPPEYVLVKLVGPNILWAELSESGDWRIFSPSVPCRNCEMELGGVVIYRPFWEFR
ncbi:hypothetical protein TNCV_4249211 [Trichonephila clavipes]|nr:hypothetical protein TNCV_4249211 [Trichonephila clavipes]